MNATPMTLQTTAPVDESTTPLIWRLADSMYEVKCADLPEAAREQAGRCLLDTLGCIAAGLDHPAAVAFSAAESEVFADRGLGGAISLARRWGYSGDVFELNDLVGGHASIGAVSAILSHELATVREHDVRSDQTDVLLALTIAIETTTRLFESHSWEKKTYAEAGMVVTSVLSSIGVAAGVGRLLGLDRQQYREALAIAGATAGWGPSEVIFGDGGTIKPSQFGAGPAETGLRAVAQAQAGITGPPRILESRMGFFATVAHSFDPGMVLGSDGWRIEKVQRKLHACCGYIHSSLDALQSLREDGVALAGATSVEVAVPAAVYEAVAKDADPVNENDARFHLRYMVALVLAGHYPILPAHSVEFETYLDDPAVSRAMRAVRLTILDDVPRQEGNRFNSSRVNVSRPGREPATAVCDGPRGTARNPMTKDEIRAKFISLATPRLGSELIEEVQELLLAGAEVDPEAPDGGDVLTEVLQTLAKES